MILYLQYVYNLFFIKKISGFCSQAFGCDGMFLNKTNPIHLSISSCLQFVEFILKMYLQFVEFILKMYFKFLENMIDKYTEILQCVFYLVNCSVVLSVHCVSRRVYGRKM